MTNEATNEVRALIDEAERLLLVDTQAAAEATRLAREAVEASPDPQRALLRLHLRAVELGLVAEGGDWLSAAREALLLLADARETGDPGVRAHAANVLGICLDTMDQTEEALAAYTESAEGWRQAGEQGRLARVLGNVGVAWSRLGDEEQALAHYDEALRVSGAHPRDGGLLRHRLNRVLSLIRLDRASEAREELTESAELLEESGQHRTLPQLLFLQARTAELEYRTQEAAALYQEAFQLADREGQDNLACPAAEAMARMLRTSDPEAAIAAAQAALPAAERFVSTEWRSRLHSVLSDLHADQGALSQALFHLRAHHEAEARFLRARTDARLGWLRVRHRVDALTRQNAELAEAKERLELLVRERDEFMDIASHDLRAPLSTLFLVGDELIGDFPRMHTELELGTRVNAAAHRMRALLDQLATTHAIDKGRELSIAMGPIGPAVDAAISVVQGMAERKQSTIEVEGEWPQAWIDSRALEQVVQNLLGNAVKFSPPGSRIRLRMEEGVRITVEDQGPGFIPEDFPRLFRRFSRATARPTNGESSSGLGLYIVRKLTEGMGGSVEVENLPDGGARFVVSLRAG